MSSPSTTANLVLENVRRLLDDISQLKAKVLERDEKIAVLQQEIDNNNIVINQLKQQINQLNSRNSLAPKGDSSEITALIDNLVENIDKSLALLNNDKADNNAQ